MFAIAGLLLALPPEGGSYRAAEPLFVESAAATGLNFTHVSGASGQYYMAEQMGAGVALFDYDNDGYLDLFLTGFGAATLFHNNGDGTFTDVTAKAGVADPLWTTSAAFVDYDRDGRLDLFVARYLDFSLASNKVCHDAVGARDYCSPRSYKPVPARLYHNDEIGRAHV